jgi:DNA repair exonuclease SbcCD ATPase subunit
MVSSHRLFFDGESNRMRYQLSRFLALLNNFDTALKATNTSLHSQGSAFRENQKYQESLEARINKLKNTFTELSLAVGNAVLTDSFIGVVEGLGNLAEFGAKVANTFGVLPTIIAAVYGGFVLFGKQAIINKAVTGALEGTITRLSSAYMLVNSNIRATTASIAAQTAGLTGFSRVAKIAQISIGGLVTTLRGLLASTGVGLVLVGLGFAVEKLISKITEYNEKQLQIKQESQQLASTYASNEEKIQSLADKYEKLSNEVNKGLRPENDKEYLQVQQELYNLLPTLAERVDSKGQAHLRSAEAVRQEIESIKELAKLESQNFVDNFDKKVDKVKNNIEDLQRQINNIKNPPMTAVDWKAGIPNELTTEDKIDIAIKQREINAQIEQAIGLYKQYAQAYADYLGVKKQLNDADTEYINKLIEENKATLLTKKGREDLTKQIQDYIGKASEVRKVTGDLFSSKQIKKFTDDQILALKLVVNAVKNGNTDWDEHKKKLTNAGISASVASKAIKYLSGALDENKNAVKSNAISLEDLDEKLKEAKGDFDALAKIIIQLAKQGNYSQAMTIAMSEAYQALADEVAPLNELLEKLAQGKQISAAEAMELIQKEHELAGAISIENGVVKVNREAVSKLRDAKVASYNDMLKSVEIEAKATANATLSKLRNYGIEIQAIQNLQDAKRRLAELEDLRNIANSGMGSWDTRDQINKAYEDVKSVVDLYENIQNLSSLVSTGLNQVGTSFENLSESQDKSNKETEKSIYVADQYQLALSKLNAEIQKIQSLQSKYPKHSESYRKALKQEIALLQEKKQLMQEQAASLEQQIKSGKIQETGIISIPKSTTVSGNSKEAIIWNFFKSKGFSDSVVAGILGNLKHESGLSTTIVNPTSGATGLAQWLGSRLTGLKRYASSLGRSWKDLDVQLNYMWKELNSTEKRTLNWLLRNQNADPTTVATMFEKLYERAGGAGLSSRISYANQYYRKFANGNVSGDVSKQIAEQQQSIDQAKEDLNSLKAEISDLGAQISERYMEIHRSKIAEFDREREKLKNNIELYEMEKQALDESSEAYRQRIKNQMILERKSNKALQSEIKWAERQIKYDKNLSAADKDELRQFIAERQKMLRESNQQLAQWALDIHKSKIAEFDKDHERLENHISLYEQQKQLVDETSKKYRQITQNQIILENKKIASLKSEIAWAERQLKYDKNLDEAGKAFLREFIAERQKLLQESTQQVAQWQQDIILSSLHELYIQIDKTFDAMEDRVSRLQHQLKMLGDTEFHPFTIGIMTDEIDALIQEREQTRKDLNRLKQEQKKLKKDSEPYKENLAKIAELEKRLMTIDENIIQADADLKDYYTRVAEQVIEAEKRYYEEKKQIALDALEKEREKIEEVYETEMKAIEDAHEARMRAIDEQLRALERLKETDDYNKQLNKLNKERQEILNQINKLALDDSQETNAKRMELQKQLAEKEDEINELKNNREYELRRQNLEDLREKLNEEYENERETREKSYEDLTENLDKRREEIEKYYDDIINDTRRWDNITQQILSGQFNNLRKELSNMQTDVAKTMDSASNSVYELVKALEEAQKAMSSLGNNSKINYNETHKQINEALDDPVYWDGAELKDGQIGRIKILKPINLWKRDAQGKLQFVRVLKPGEVFRVYGYDNKYGGQYNVGSGYWITNMKGYVQYETPSKEKLREAQMFDTGGYTGEDEGLAYLHKKEIVLNETDTKNFLDTVKELRSFDSMQILDSLKAATMNFMRIPKIQLPNLSPALAGGGTIQIDNLIHIDKVEKDANINIEKLADQAIDRLITKLKPYGFFK